MIAFQLSEKQERAAKEWMRKVDPFDENNPDDCLKHGPIGGEFTYSFTPTPIGTVIRLYYLKGTPEQQMIDLSDYEMW